MSNHDEASAIQAATRSYLRIEREHKREYGPTASLDIIPDRRWLAEEKEDGSWVVSGYGTSTAILFDEPPLVRFNVGTRQVRQIS